MVSLRGRLFISYLLLIIITLGILAVAFLLATSTRPAPPQPTYQRLATLVRGLNIADLLNEYTPRSSNERQPTIRNLLDYFAATRNTRVIAVNITRNIVTYDSENLIESGQPLKLAIDDYRLPRDNLLNQIQLIQGTELMFGRFKADGQDWLFSGIVSNQQGEDHNIVMVTELLPTQSLQSQLREIGSSLAVPILQAGVIGLIIAALLAAFISRTIAHPLQAASIAATSVAEGNLNQHVPVTGPPEVRSVAEAFNYMSARVRTTQAAQRDFMTNVSHDLKTPLTSIQGYSQAIMDGAAKDPARAASIIYDEATRLNRMVSGITDLARMQSGQFELHFSPVDLRQVIMAVIDKMHVIVENQQLTLQASLSSTLPLIQGDGDRLVQVFDNLIGNAIKYTPAGGKIHVKAHENQHGIEIIIQDTGVGIPRHDLTRIFERFYQVDKVRGPSRGTGLGLAITKEIIQAHKGQITVQSQPGEGTIFTVWLPSQ